MNASNRPHRFPSARSFLAAALLVAGCAGGTASFPAAAGTLMDVKVVATGSTSRLHPACPMPE